MIGLTIAFVVVPTLWLAFEMYRAPVAIECPDGLCVLEPGRRLDELLPLEFDYVAPHTFWGLG